MFSFSSPSSIDLVINQFLNASEEQQKNKAPRTPVDFIMQLWHGRVLAAVSFFHINVN